MNAKINAIKNQPIQAPVVNPIIGKRPAPEKKDSFKNLFSKSADEVTYDLASTNLKAQKNMTEPEVDDFKRLQEKLVQLAMQKQVKANQNMTKPISAFSKVDYMKNLGAQQQVQQLTKPEQMLIYRNQTIEKVNVRNSECDIRKHDEIAETRYQDKQVLAPVV